MEKQIIQQIRFLIDIISNWKNTVQKRIEAANIANQLLDQQYKLILSNENQEYQQEIIEYIKQYIKEVTKLKQQVEQILLRSGIQVGSGLDVDQYNPQSFMNLKENSYNNYHKQIAKNKINNYKNFMHNEKIIQINNQLKQIEELFDYLTIDSQFLDQKLVKTSDTFNQFLDMQKQKTKKLQQQMKEYKVDNIKDLLQQKKLQNRNIVVKVISGISGIIAGINIIRHIIK